MSTVLSHTPTELVLTRLFDAPRALCFAAFSQPEHLVRWWGPGGFTLPVCEVDFRTGGTFRFCMRGPDGTDYPFAGVYEEVAPLEKIVFRGLIHGGQGGERGNEAHTTVTFADEAGKTRITVRQRYTYESPATRGALQGWSESLERLQSHLKG